MSAKLSDIARRRSASDARQGASVGRSPSHDAGDERALVQARLGTLYGVLAAIVLGLFVIGVAGGLWVDRAWPDAEALRRRAAHLGTGLALLCVHALCRGPARSPRQLAAIDLGAMWAVSAAAAISVSSTRGVHVELMGVLVVALMSTLRAALVPTTPRWTLVVAVVSAVPAPLGTALAVMRDPTWDATSTPRGTFVLVAAAWSAAAVGAAWTIAKVIYGLRSEVRDARRFGPYTIEEKIGEGGMGVVYRARHALLRRPTALKLLAPQRSDASCVRRFEREVQITSQLRHPNTVAVYDFGRTRDGLFYYAMELLDGVSLEELVEREGPQPPARVRRIVMQIAGALAEAHAAGLVHRDVKPANVFLCARGAVRDFVKVLDFGLVKDLGVPRDEGLSHANAIMGTPHYMAPEMVLSPDDVDARADLYALGGLAYFLLTGQPPFEGNNIVEICSQHLHVAPVAPSRLLGCAVDADLEALVMACLAKSRSQRPDSADAIRGALRRGRRRGSARRRRRRAPLGTTRPRPAAPRRASRGSSPSR